MPSKEVGKRNEVLKKDFRFTSESYFDSWKSFGGITGACGSIADRRNGGTGVKLHVSFAF